MGRPKLKPGEKGNYHVSRKVQLRREARKVLDQAKREANKKERQVLNARRNLQKKKEGLSKLQGAESGKTPAAITEDDLKAVPPRVREAIEASDKVVFRPNEGPQTSFLAAPEREVLYGGAAGGGKSYAMLVDLLRYAHLKDYRALLLRRTLSELTELIDKSKSLYHEAFPGSEFKESKSLWVFPSGATAHFSYVDRDSDVTRYQGQAYQWIGVDELGHYATPYVWDYLRSRLRSTNPAIKPCMRATANPGYVGGWWIKKMFIDRADWGKPFWAADMETGAVLKYPAWHEKSGTPLFQRRFIPAKLTDNPFLMHSDEYMENLMSLPEVERRRLLEGDWDVAEGAAFTEFDRSVHVVEPYELPKSWIRIRSGDYGYASPSAILWGAVDWDGNIVVYRELYAKGYTGEALAQKILELESEDPPIQDGILDSSCWAKRGETGPSIAESMIHRGVRWRQADRARVAGKIEVHRRLATDEMGQAKLKFFSNCKNLIRTLPTIPLADNNPEDVDTKSDDHCYDALRYMVMSRPTVARSLGSEQSFKTSDAPPPPQDAMFGY